jgi:cytochrome P450
VTGYRFPPGLQRNLAWYFLTRRFKPGHPVEFFTYLGKNFGPIAHYKIGREHVVYLNDPELIKEVLINQHQNFTKERTQDRMKILVGEGLITSEGKFHQRQRHLAQPAFHRDRIAGYAATMVDRALRWRTEWERKASGPLDVAREMMHLSLSIVGKTLFDSDIESEMEEIAAEVNAMMRLYHLLVTMPRVEHLLDYPIPGLRRFRRARQRIDATVYRMIAEHRRGDRDRGDLLSMLLAASYEDGSGMSDEQLRDEVITIFLAGYETTANALTWTWYLLSQNPEVEAKLHAEIDSVLGVRNAEFDDVPQLRYTRMVVGEAMRLYPPAWAMGRRAQTDIEIAGYRLPKRTSFFMTQLLMHRNPEYFPDPLRFDPERFAPENEAKRPRFAYFPFGGGKRQCIGESFAWTELVLVIATLAQRWKPRLAPGQIVEPQPLITLRPKYGMKMLLEAR